ncbi:dihydrofolate reductase family protein [Achromobacter aloeverae]|uniref:Deaminase n=1 Tax=Achromobacter aloeverae TaxID=1750518 RepID=A0A4Q1HJ68_9BURK|nr:dihydrofolate reductase family protein [Achromobacter aloeverae]RXN86974.1 deaminase [Achromobacter aloeverae]
MRKLILQMQSTMDGFVEASDGKPWQVWNWGPDCTWDVPLQRYFNDEYAKADCVLLSRNMAEGGFIDHWARMAVDQAGNPAFDFARRVGKIEKAIASRHAFSPRWPRTRAVVGNLASTISELKAESGSNILTFGGVTFASELLRLRLVDELQLFVNPATVHDGRTIFAEGVSRFRLLGADAYACGIAVVRYAVGA